MIILCADDYGLSDGVSRGILELCRARRLSATSAMVTFERWQTDAALLCDVRETTALGLHLNLTLGRPLLAREGARHLDRDGRFLPIGTLIRRAAFRKAEPGRLIQSLNQDAIYAECHAQISAFRNAVGALPDFIDGHQHVHVLRAIRPALLRAIADFPWGHPPLVRVPSNVGRRGWPERREWGKRAAIAGLSLGMRNTLAAAGLCANDTFSGFSSFTSGRDYGEELAAALLGGGRCHLVMCHPGHVDAELAQRGDPLVERRGEELAGMLAFEDLPARIWHPVRDGAGSIDWHAMKQNSPVIAGQKRDER